MKKLLYTLILGLTFVACDKDNSSDLITAVTPAELEIQDQAKMNIDLEQRWNAFVEHVAGIEIPKGTTLPASANKGGDNGANWIEIVYFLDADGTTGYVYIRPDNLGVGCYDGISAGVSSSQIETYTLKDVNGVLNLDIQDGDSADSFIAPIPAGSDFAFNLFFGNQGSTLLFAQNNFLGWSPTAGALPTATVND